MKLMLEQKNITDVVDFGPYYSYEHTEERYLINSLVNHFDNIIEKVNIICHSMGCNIGLILAKERASKINKAIFLSPELQKTSRRGKRIPKMRILHGLTPKNDFSIERPVNMGILSKLRLYKVFNQRRTLALQSLDIASQTRKFPFSFFLKTKLKLNLKIPKEL